MSLIGLKCNEISLLLFYTIVSITSIKLQTCEIANITNYQYWEQFYLWPDDGLMIEAETCCHLVTLNKINIHKLVVFWLVNLYSLFVYIEHKGMNRLKMHNQYFATKLLKEIRTWQKYALKNCATLIHLYNTIINPKLKTTSISGFAGFQNVQTLIFPATSVMYISISKRVNISSPLRHSTAGTPSVLCSPCRFSPVDKLLFSHSSPGL